MRHRDGSSMKVHVAGSDCAWRSRPRGQKTQFVVAEADGVRTSAAEELLAHRPTLGAFIQWQGAVPTAAALQTPRPALSAPANPA